MQLPKIIFEEVTSPSEEKISHLKISKPQTIHEGVQLATYAKQILLPSFTMLILGKPGSGKSHVISQLITQPNFYGNRFDRIIYIGPTKFKGVIHDSYNTKVQLDIQWLNQKIKQCQAPWCENMLIIFDDVISSIPATHKSRLQQLFFNRRHELKYGCISIIITSQKYTTVPTWLRTTMNCLLTFSIPLVQLKGILNQVSLKKAKQYIQYKYKNLPKHSFIFHNIETGHSFSDNFLPL